MSDKEIAAETQAKSTSETHNSLVTEAYNFCADTVAHPEARGRQAFVATYGTIVGGIKDLPNEFMHHPWETVGKVAVAGGGGVAIGAALASESPAIVAAASAASVAATAAALWNSFTRITSNETLKNSMDAVYKNADQKTLVKSMETASAVLGPEAVDYGLAIAAGLAAAHGPEAFSRLQWNSLINKLKPYIPIATATENGATEIEFLDNSILHMHGDQVIYQIAGEEYSIPRNHNGIDMSILGSIAGRQVIKTWEIPKIGNFLQPLKVDINPDLGVTKVSSYRGNEEINHNKLDELFSRQFLSCFECEPNNPNAPWNRSQ